VNTRLSGEGRTQPMIRMRLAIPSFTERSIKLG
jgi:hypothetical protein